MKNRITSGIEALDALLGGLYVGDNVIWYDDAGSLADVFYLHLIRATVQQGAPLIYVSFDRSLKNLIEKLGPLAQSETLTIIDCFTYGKGNGAKLFVEYQQRLEASWPGTLVTVATPHRMEAVAEAFYGHHRSLQGTVRFIFESLTGMQDLWGGEEQLVGFYVRACPHLYDLNTIAYWLIEKQAHTNKLRAQINQVAQVVIDLSVRRGHTALGIIKAENRSPKRGKKPISYFSRDNTVHFSPQAQAPGKTDLGARIRSLRLQAQLSQTALAKRVGVTPSTISQVESGLIYPSLPALFRMAEVFSTDMGSFFDGGFPEDVPIVLRPDDLQALTLPEVADTGVKVWHLPRAATAFGNTILIVELPAGIRLSRHFCPTKGEEIGHLLHGQLTLTYQGRDLSVSAGDCIHLPNGPPSAWTNSGDVAARLFWLVAGQP
jgi:transcriptional regulator with XRE-family HTH domain/KaiC/GvpD/RAD55 family RecA-like ATPase